MQDFFTIWLPFVWSIIFVLGYVFLHKKPLKKRFIYTVVGLSIHSAYLLILALFGNWLKSNLTELTLLLLIASVLASIGYYIRYAMIKGMGMEEITFGEAKEKIEATWKQTRGKER